VTLHLRFFAALRERLRAREAERSMPDDSTVGDVWSALCVEHPEIEPPLIALLASGGHSEIVECRQWHAYTIVGSTRDDAAGEAFDKVAILLGLGFPGGPEIDRAARKGSANALAFPRAWLEPSSLDFSFSGLKTAVLYHVRGVPGKRHKAPPAPLDESQRRDIAASFQDAAVATIVEKVRRAVRKVRARSVIVGGGVSANRELRGALQDLDQPIFLPKSAYCTDNAAMSAGLAHVYYQRRDFSPLELDAITYSTFSRR
jgi:N6-L-threonylcarbamoyladenine synthase